MIYSVYAANSTGVIFHLIGCVSTEFLVPILAKFSEKVELGLCLLPGNENDRRFVRLRVRHVLNSKIYDNSTTKPSKFINRFNGIE